MSQGRKFERARGRRTVRFHLFIRLSGSFDRPLPTTAVSCLQGIRSLFPHNLFRRFLPPFSHIKRSGGTHFLCALFYIVFIIVSGRPLLLNYASMLPLVKALSIKDLEPLAVRDDR